MSALVELSRKPPELGDRMECVSAYSLRQEEKGGHQCGLSFIIPLLFPSPVPPFRSPPSSLAGQKTMSYNSGRRIIPRSWLRDWNSHPPLP